MVTLCFELHNLFFRFDSMSSLTHSTTVRAGQPLFLVIFS